MLLGQHCTLSLNGSTELVTFLGYDAGDARVQPVGTTRTIIVPVRALAKADAAEGLTLELGAPQWFDRVLDGICA